MLNPDFAEGEMSPLQEPKLVSKFDKSDLDFVARQLHGIVHGREIQGDHFIFVSDDVEGLYRLLDLDTDQEFDLYGVAAVSLFQGELDFVAPRRVEDGVTYIDSLSITDGQLLEPDHNPEHTADRRVVKASDLAEDALAADWLNEGIVPPNGLRPQNPQTHV